MVTAGMTPCPSHCRQDSAATANRTIATGADLITPNAPPVVDAEADAVPVFREPAPAAKLAVVVAVVE